MKLWAMLSMPREDRSCTRYAIGEKIIRGIGAPLLQIAGASRVMCMITGTSQIRDVLVMDLMLGIVASLASIVLSRIS